MAQISNGSRLPIAEKITHPTPLGPCRRRCRSGVPCCTETTRISVERSRDWPERMPADAAFHQHDETEPQKEKPRHPHSSEMTGLSEHSPSY
jgi:hypothetical protein